MNRELLLVYFEYKDGALYWKVKASQRVHVGSRAGYITGTKGYRQIHLKGVVCQEHRAIWIMLRGEIPDGMTVDHRNRNTSDNRIENLRLATANEQSYNRKLSSTNSSGIKGVSWNKQRNKWIGFVTVNGKQKCVGLFADIAEAEKAVTIAREKLHGSFSCDG